MVALDLAGRGRPRVAAWYAVGFLLLQELGFGMRLPPTDVAVLWPAAAWSFAAFTLAPRRFWPLLALVQVPISIGAYTVHGYGVPTAAVFAAADLAEPLLAATIARRFVPSFHPIGTGRELLGLLVSGVVVAPAVASFIGAAGIVWVAGTDVSFATSWRTWMVADAMGVFALAPLLFVTATGDRAGARRIAGLAVAAGLVATASLFVLGARLPGLDEPRAMYLLLLVAVVPSVVFGWTGAVVSVPSLVIPAVWVTANDRGPFATLDLVADRRALETQLALAAVAVVGYVTGLAVTNARNAGLRLAHAAAANAAQQVTLEAERAVAERERVGRQRAEGMQRLAAALGSAVDVDEVAQRVADHASDAVGAPFSNIALVAGDRLRLTHATGLDPSVAVRWVEIALDDHLPLSDAAREGRMVLVPNLDIRFRLYPHLPREPSTGFVATASAPMIAGDGRRLGAVGFAWTHDVAFGPEFVANLGLVADLCSQAVVRAESYDRQREARQRAEDAERRTATLARITTELVTIEGYSARGRRLPEVVVPDLGDHAAVALVADVEVIAEASAGGPVPPGLGTEALERARELAGLMSPTPVMVSLDGRSATLALHGRERVLGALVVGRLPGRGPFTHDEVELAQEVARTVGLVLDNARLYENEHDMVIRLQHAMLPMALDGGSRLALASSYLPGAEYLEVGGDWYDVVPLAGGRVGLIVGDVVGRGAPAATAMGQLRTAAATLATSVAGPANLLDRLEAFARRVEGAYLATVAYLELDPDTGDLTYASAGHPPPVLLLPDGTTRLLEEGRSAPLGGLRDRSRREATTMVPEGATLLLYTDGLVERRGRHLDEGFDRLLCALERHHDLPPERLLDAVLDELLEGERLADDVAVLCVRRLPVPAGGFSRRVPARPDALAPLRHEVRAWLRGHGLVGDTTDEVLLVIGELTANVVEHAYRFSPPGEMEVAVVLHDGPDGPDALELTVRDYGSWRSVPAAGPRGRGLPVVRALSDDVDVASGFVGTEVRVHKSLSARVSL